MRSTSTLTARGFHQEARSGGPPQQRVQRRSSGQLDEMLERLNTLIAEGLTHGFFEYSIRCDVGTGGRRQVLIQAGKSHKFNIPEDEISS